MCPRQRLRILQHQERLLKALLQRCPQAVYPYLEILHKTQFLARSLTRQIAAEQGLSSTRTTVGQRIFQ